MIKQYMHRPQSASSSGRKEQQKPSNNSTRIRTQEKQKIRKDMSLRESVHHVHFDQERSFDHSKKSLGACDLDVKNPELISLLNVDKKLLDDKDWGRHLKDQCLCKLCNCGKHVCHLHPIKLGLTVPDSTYTRNYRNQGNCPNERVRMPTEAKHDSTIVGTSNYHNEYGRKHTDLEHPKKFKDNLHIGGPMVTTTTYKQNYVQKNSPSQYVNNQLMQLTVDKAINFPVGTPLTGASNYRETFKWRTGRPSVVVIAPDLMPVQSTLAFLGKSSYQSDFKAPTREQYPQRVYDPRRRMNSIGPSSNKTTYRNEFSNNHTSMCPAEVERRRNPSFTVSYN